MRRNRLLAIALMVAILPTMMALSAGCSRSSYGASPESTTINGRTATVSIVSDRELAIDLEGQGYTYTRSAPGAMATASLAGPEAAPAEEYQLVSEVVDQWLSGHKEWAYPRPIQPGVVLGGLLVVGLGVLSLAKPDTIWYITEGWKFRDAEPSDLALGMTRFGGVIMVLVGLLMIGNAR